MNTMDRKDFKEELFDQSYILVTAGTDVEFKFAWSIREYDGRKYVVLNKRKNGMSCFSKSDYITAIPLDNLIYAANILK